MTVLTLLVLSISLLIQPAPADSISLQYCYQQAFKNYPSRRNIELQHKITEVSADIARSGYFPQINVSGKAIYQSEVTEFSIPGGGGPLPISKDQYEDAVDVTQTIFNPYFSQGFMV